MGRSRINVPYPKNETEIWIEIGVMVISNLFGLFGIVRAFRKRIYTAAFIGIWCVFTSILYHIGDTTRNTVLGMNPGKWHRLDNIFIIAAVQKLWFYLFDIREDTIVQAHVVNGENKKKNVSDKADYPDAVFFYKRRTLMDGLFTFCFCFTIWAQEFSPWNEFFTFFPIVFSFLLNYPFLYYFTLPKNFRPVFDFRQLGIGLGCLLVGLFFFVKGLDEKSDYLRLNHGMWHVFVAMAVYHIQASRRIIDPAKLYNFCKKKKKKKKGKK